MAAPAPEPKPEIVTPSPSREPPTEPQAAASDRPLQPWEQHAAVINLPRYDYRASGSHLLRSHSGFLITCPIKREKSATKEAISILEDCIGHANSYSSEEPEPCDMKVAAKKRKICSEAPDIEKSGDALSRSGLLLFSLPSGGLRVVQMLTQIFHSLQSGKLKSPQWCHRIFPIQETCVLSETDLHATVSKLFLDFVKDKEDQDEPIKMKGQKNDNEGSKQQTLMEREQCFKVIAAAVKSVAKNSMVDLRSPEVAVLVEMLPISGVPLGSSVAGVSVLPSELVSTKPRLCVKALVLDAKAKKK
ncbi:hypothetical protein ABZP36_032016 [Zizania latifolia]